MWVVAKAVFKEKFIALNVYIRKRGRCNINDLGSHLKEPKKKVKPKVRRKNIIKQNPQYKMDFNRQYQQSQK